MLGQLKFKHSHLWLLGSILAGAVLTLGQGNSYAQSRPPGTAALSEMPSQPVSGCYRSVYEDVPIGLEIFGAFARLGSDYVDGCNSIMVRRDPTQVVFRLASSNAPSQYRRLTLSFGISDNTSYARNGAVSRLSVYKDGQFHGYRDVYPGSQNAWIIDVSGARSLAFEGTCVRSSYSTAYAGVQACGSIYFFEEILER